MDDLSTNTVALPDHHSTLEPSARSTHELSLLSQPASVLGRQSPGPLGGWETVSEQDFCDELDFLSPGYNLTCEKLKNRKEDDVVIFDYQLSCADENLPIEGGLSSGRSSRDNDIFFRVSKDRLAESEQFNQIINQMKEPRLTQSSRPRLGIIDFPQCYDTYDDDLLNLVGEKLGLLKEGETAFMDAYSQRVRVLPGRGCFRTGISLRASLKEPPGLPKLGSPEDKFILFVSFPYFGESRGETTLGFESESVQLLDFKSLGTDPVRGPRVGEEIAEVKEILVHQARYMVFNNYTMATFRSKEDTAKDQVPLHPFQESVGAIRAMIHMIANRMDSGLLTLEKLQASLCKLEGDIDQVISGGKTSEGSQGMELPRLGFRRRMTSTLDGKLKSSKKYKQAQQRWKWKRVRALRTSLNGLSAGFFAAISVAERQAAILQDLHKILLISYRTEAKDHEKRYPPLQNPSYPSAFRIPIISEYPKLTWRNIIDTIDEMVQERKSFIRKIKELVENLDVGRKILVEFLESTTKDRIEGEPMQQEQSLSFPGYVDVTLAFIPLNFCTSFYGMNLKELEENKPTLHDFQQFAWIMSTFVFLTLMAATIRDWALSLLARKKIDDIEKKL